MFLSIVLFFFFFWQGKLTLMKAVLSRIHILLSCLIRVSSLSVFARQEVYKHLIISSLLYTTTQLNHDIKIMNEVMKQYGLIKAGVCSSVALK